MMRRTAFLSISEFGEVLNVEVIEDNPSKKIFHVLAKIRVFKPANLYSFDFSANCSKGFSSNQISKELFWIQNFLMEGDWRLKLDSYDDFCSNRL